MGLEGRKQERGSSPQQGQGAENGDTDRVCRTGLDTAGGCETRAIPWGRDLSLAVLRSPGRCHPSKTKSEAAEHGAVQGQLWRAGIVLLECQQSCGGAAVPPRHAGGHSPLSEHSQDTVCQELVPSRRVGKLPTLCTAWMEHHGERKGDEVPSAFAGRRGPQEGSQGAGLQAEALSTRSPQAGWPQGRSLPASNILLHPTAHGHLSSPAATGHCCEGPHPGDSSRQGPCHPSAPAPRLTPPGPGDSHVGSPAAAQRRLSPRCGNSQLSARQGQRDFTGTSPAGGRPPSPRRPRFLSQ